MPLTMDLQRVRCRPASVKTGAQRPQFPQATESTELKLPNLFATRAKTVTDLRKSLAATTEAVPHRQHPQLQPGKPEQILRQTHAMRVLVHRAPS